MKSQSSCSTASSPSWPAAAAGSPARPRAGDPPPTPRVTSDRIRSDRIPRHRSFLEDGSCSSWGRRRRRRGRQPKECQRRVRSRCLSPSPRGAGEEEQGEGGPRTTRPSSSSLTRVAAGPTRGGLPANCAAAAAAPSASRTPAHDAVSSSVATAVVVVVVGARLLAAALFAALGAEARRGGAGRTLAQHDGHFTRPALDIRGGQVVQLAAHDATTQGGHARSQRALRGVGWVTCGAAARRLTPSAGDAGNPTDPRPLATHALPNTSPRATAVKIRDGGGGAHRCRPP